MKKRNFEKYGFKAEVLGVSNNYLLLINDKIYREGLKTISHCKLIFNLYVDRKTNVIFLKSV